MESLSLESSEEELEEEEDDEELVDEDVSEEEVLAFLFFLSFTSFFFSAIHKQRLSGAALVPHAAPHCQTSTGGSAGFPACQNKTKMALSSQQGNRHRFS